MFSTVVPVSNGIFYASSQETIWRYADGSWSLYSELPEVATNIYIAAPTAAWCTTQSGNIYASTDNLLQWSNQYHFLDAQEQPIPLWSIAGIGTRHLWAIGQSNTILHSTDGGTTWNVEQTPLPPQRFFHTIAPVDSTLCFAIGSDGKVYRAHYTTLSADARRLPGHFSIAPQPVQNTCILLGLADGEYRGEIYALDGRLLRIIHLAPQQRTLDCSSLAPGAYLVRIGAAVQLLLKQ